MVTAAVRPTPEDPLPVVVIALGAVFSTYLNICDLATLGSPIRRILMSLKNNNKIYDIYLTEALYSTRHLKILFQLLLLSRPGRVVWSAGLGILRLRGRGFESYCTQLFSLGRGSVA